MTVAIQPEAPPLRVDEGGAVRIGQSRVPLVRLIEAFHNGVSPEMFCHQYDTVMLADAYGVIAYYLRHRAEVDAFLAEEERRAEEIWREIESRQGPQAGLRERILARRNGAPKAALPSDLTPAPGQRS